MASKSCDITLLPERRGLWKPGDVTRICEAFGVSETWLKGELPIDPIIIATDSEAEIAEDEDSEPDSRSTAPNEGDSAPL